MDSKKLRFLLLEDDQDHAEIFLSNLELTSFHNASVDHFQTMAEGFSQLIKQHYDLVFVDLSLKDSNVRRTLGTLKELSELATVVVITSLDDRSTLLDIINKGADDCIPKSELNDFVLERTIHFNLDRAESNKRLKDSEAAYRDLYHNSPIYHATFELESRKIISCNGTLAQSIGWRAKDLIGVDVLGIYHADCQEKALQLHERLTAETLIQNEQLQLMRKDGSAREVLLNISSVPGSERTKQHCHATWVDITEKVATENKLFQLQTLHQQILTIIDSPVWMKDLKGRYQTCNEAFANLLGSTIPDVIGRTSRDFFDETHCQKIQKQDAAALTQGPLKENLWIQPPNAKDKVLLEITKIPLRDAKDEIIGVVSYGHDVTFHYHHEQVLVASSDKLKSEQAKLLESENKLKTLFEAVPVGIIRQDADGRILAVNDKAVELLEIDKETLLSNTPYKPKWQLIDQDGVQIEENVTPLTLRLGGTHGSRTLGLAFADKTRWLSINSVAEQTDNEDQANNTITCFIDVSKNIELAQALKISDDRNQLAQKMYGIGVWEWQITTDEVFWSTEMCDMWGVEQDSFTGDLDAVKQLIHPDDFETWYLNVENSLKTGDDHEMEFRIIRTDNQIRWIYALGRCELINGQPALMTGVCTDVTEERRAHQKLKRAASVFSHAQEGIIITDVDGYIIETNEAFQTITGYQESEVLGQKPSLLKSGKHSDQFYQEMWAGLIKTGNWQGELWNKGKGGDFFAESLTITAVRDDKGGTTHYVGVFSDITERKLHEAALEESAYLDELTRLPNRRFLQTVLEHKQHQKKRNDFAILFIDFDGFKEINDTYGHAEGDQLLITISNRLGSQVRSVDTVSRLGGDEFIILIDEWNNVELLNHLAQRVLKACATPIRLTDAEVSVTASIGVVFTQNNQVLDIDALIDQADKAMYKAKTAGKNQLCLEPYHI